MLAIPKAVPGNVRELGRAALRILKQLDVPKIWHHLPSSLSRLHVDWILVKPAVQEQALSPEAVVVAEIRDRDYSSDHFPVLAVFKLSP